jgi:hypothetical protein
VSIIGRLDIPQPGVCRVMFCIATDHDGGTQHYDFTGRSYTSCVHGNLSQWDPCEECGFGDENSPEGGHLDTLTRDVRRFDKLRADWLKRFGEDNRNVKDLERRINVMLFSIGVTVAYRTKREGLAGYELIDAGRTYVDSSPTTDA